MLEFHAWITIRETYKDIEDEEEKLDELIDEIKMDIAGIKWNKPEIKMMNGEYFIEISLFSNHKTEEYDELMDFFASLAKKAIGSYGLIYLLDDEDMNDKHNEFQVYSISRGEIHCQEDSFLSPFIPTVEDEMD